MCPSGLEGCFGTIWKFSFLFLLQSAEGKEGSSDQWGGIKTEGRAKEPAQEEWSQWHEWDSFSETQQLQ